MSEDIQNRPDLITLDSFPPLRQLDMVLEKLTPKDRFIPCINSFQIASALNKEDISASPRDVDFILYELVNDGYATSKRELRAGIVVNFKKLIDIDEPFYFITFSGRVHLQNGGYVGALERETRDTEREKRNDKYLRWGALWAGSGTVAFLIWDFVKYAMEHNWWFYCRHCCH